MSLVRLLMVRISVILITFLSLEHVGAEILGNIDFRKRSDPNNYEVSFCARESPGESGLPGHAFVVFSYDNHQGRSFLAIGHSPSEESLKTALGVEVGGLLKKEKYSAIVRNCFLVKLDQESYEKGYTLTRPTLEKLGLVKQSKDNLTYFSYKLAAQDCVTFIQDVAGEIGLKVAQREGFSNFPMRYIKKFWELNR